MAMTTGGPDTSDVFEEEVAGGKYRFRTSGVRSKSAASASA